MKQHLEEEAELRGYLLGELGLEEQVSVEARLFLDEEYLSQLRAVEDELIDAYAYGELAPGEREKVESRLLSKPGRREDLRIARALRKYLSHDDLLPPGTPAADSRRAADPGPASDEGALPSTRGKGPISFLSSLFVRRPAVGFALAAVALAILSAVVWFSSETLRRPARPAETQAHGPTPQQSSPAERVQPGGELQANQRPPEQGGEVAQREDRTPDDVGGREKGESAGQRNGRPQETPAPPRQTPTRVATFLILPGGVVRGAGGSEKVVISPDIGAVILRLPVVAEGDYSSYRATLLDGRGVVYSVSDLKPEVDAKLGQVVAVRVPANRLRQGRYEMKLGGVTADGQTRDLTSYTVPVERR